MSAGPRCDADTTPAGDSLSVSTGNTRDIIERMHDKQYVTSSSSTGSSRIARGGWSTTRSYPTPKIEENSHRFRPLGLGYANLGALLMNRGLAYDSGGRAQLRRGDHRPDARRGLSPSSVIARDHGGAFRRVQRRPRNPSCASSRSIAMPRTRSPREGVPTEMLEAARRTYDEALELGRKHGYRNAQVTVLAPTGTIAFMMDCDTTGVEPDIALIKYKKLVGEGYLKIVNQTVPAALLQARLRTRPRSRRSSPMSTSARRSRGHRA